MSSFEGALRGKLGLVGLQGGDVRGTVPGPALDFGLQKGEQAVHIAKEHGVPGLDTLSRGMPAALFRALPKTHQIRTIAADGD